jgi:hypothetical protein
MSRRKVRGFIKCAVERIVVQAATTTRERVATEVPEGTEGAIPVTQDDGSTKFFVVTFKGTPEIVKQGRALGSTTKGGQRNTTDNMAPKGGKQSAPVMRSKK